MNTLDTSVLDYSLCSVEENSGQIAASEIQKINSEIIPNPPTLGQFPYSHPQDVLLATIGNLNSGELAQLKTKFALKILVFAVGLIFLR